MTRKQPTSPPGGRIRFLDNLRTVIVFLVVLFHVGLIYESSGIPAAWWIVDDPATHDMIGIVNLILDIAVMPTLFLIAGYLTPRSLKARGRRRFLAARFRRLMVPWALAVVTLVPLYEVIFLAARGLPQQHWTGYFHVANETSQNWLWFLPVLFLFSLIYALLDGAGWAPRKLRLGAAVALFSSVGFANSLGLELLGLQGWTKTWLLDFQNERLLVYFLTFLLGTLCFHHRVFAARPRGKRLYILAAATSWVPINAYLLFLLVPWIKPGTVLVSPLADRALLWAAFHLSLASLVYLFVGTFHRFLDRAGGAWQELDRNSYGVYVLHVVVLGGIALALLGSDLPALIKYLVVTMVAWLACNLLVSLYRRGAAALQRAGRQARLSPSPPATI